MQPQARYLLPVQRHAAQPLDVGLGVVERRRPLRQALVQLRLRQRRALQLCELLRKRVQLLEHDGERGRHRQGDAGRDQRLRLRPRNRGGGDSGGIARRRQQRRLVWVLGGGGGRCGHAATEAGEKGEERGQQRFALHLAGFLCIRLYRKSKFLPIDDTPSANNNSCNDIVEGNK